MDKLYLIDAINLLFRAYYAIGPMTNPQGESTHALYGFIRSFFKLMNDLSPNHLVAVFDGPDNKKSRTDLYSQYKSNRTGMPEDLFPQLERAHEFCKMAGIPLLEKEGVEADDVMGSIAKWAEKQGTTVYICTSDKDLCQLVSDKIFLIHLHKDNLLIDKHKVEELYGVKPSQIVDYLAMVGDASDNIPGLEGFGPKTASALLQEFGNLETILAHPEKVKGAKKQETLKNGVEIALLSQRLATIHTDLNIPTEEDFFRVKMPDLPALRTFYKQMGFLSLLKELDQEKPAKTLEKAETLDYQTVDDEKGLEKLIQHLQSETLLCIDTETTDLHPMKARIVGIGLAAHPKTAWYIPLNGKLGRDRVLNALEPFFRNNRIGFYGHNLKYDLHLLLNEGCPFPKICFDTILASYLIAPQRMRHNLDELTLEKFGKTKIAIQTLIGTGKKQISMLEVPIEKVSEYCCQDLDYTCRLKAQFEKELKEKDLLSVFHEIELPLIPVLIRMERNGIYLDAKKIKALGREIEEKIAAIQEKIEEDAGEKFNLNSPKQLSGILFEKLNIQPAKKTMTGFSTSAEVLHTLQEEHPIIPKILEYRTLEKLRSTYVETLPQQVFSETGRIHCTFNQSVAATGRLSCQDPNLQNIPIRSIEGRKIRSAFCPQNPHWRYLSADYSQIELRLLAHLSEDPLLIRAFNQGEDIHAFTASEVFDVPLSSVTSEMRHKAKAVNFGILYGQQAFGLSQGLAIEYQEAAAYIDAYFKRYKKVQEFLNFCKEEARKTGKAVTMTGRQRPIPEIDSKNPVLRAAAERLAVNTPLQGTAADLIKLAMIQVDTLLEQHKELGMMILQIHDELLFEVPDEKKELLAEHVKHLMEGVFSLRVPLTVDISFGINWGEC
jgi:DNA polymerase-1